MNKRIKKILIGAGITFGGIIPLFNYMINHNSTYLCEESIEMTKIDELYSLTSLDVYKNGMMDIGKNREIGGEFYNKTFFEEKDIELKETIKRFNFPCSLLH